MNYDEKALLKAAGVVRTVASVTSWLVFLGCAIAVAAKMDHPGGLIPGALVGAVVALLIRAPMMLLAQGAACLASAERHLAVIAQIQRLNATAPEGERP